MPADIVLEADQARRATAPADRLKATLRSMLDSFLLRPQESEVAARAAETNAVIATLVRWAERRLAVAEQLGDDADLAAAFAVYREAAALLVAAHVAQRRRTTVLADNFDAASAWRDFDVEPMAEPHRSALPALERVRRLLESTDVASIDRLPNDDGASTRKDVMDVVVWLRSGIEARSLHRIRAIRATRVVVTAAVLVALLAFMIAAARAPKNIARGKPVTMSSRHAGTPAPAALTNGTIETGYGIHTDLDDPAWAVVDLTRNYRLREVRVYGRGDGYQSEGVPLLLEVSPDGNNYVEVATRTVPIHPSAPWLIQLGGKDARFMRLRTPHRGCFALAELEVYE